MSDPMTPDPAPRLIADRLDKTCKVDLDYVYLRHSQWAELRDAIFAALPVAPTPFSARSVGCVGRDGRMRGEE